MSKKKRRKQEKNGKKELFFFFFLSPKEKKSPPTPPPLSPSYLRASTASATTPTRTATRRLPPSRKGWSLLRHLSRLAAGPRARRAAARRSCRTRSPRRPLPGARRSSGGRRGQQGRRGRGGAGGGGEGGRRGRGRLCGSPGRVPRRPLEQEGGQDAGEGPRGEDVALDDAAREFPVVVFGRWGFWGVVFVRNK